MGYRISMGIDRVMDMGYVLPIWNMCYRYGIWYIDMVIYHIDIVWISIWDTG